MVDDTRGLLNNRKFSKSAEIFLQLFLDGHSSELFPAGTKHDLANQRPWSQKRQDQTVKVRQFVLSCTILMISFELHWRISYTNIFL